MRKLLLVVIVIGLLAFMFVAGLVVLGAIVLAAVGFVAWRKIEQLLKGKKKSGSQRPKNRVIDAEFEIIDDD